MDLNSIINDVLKEELSSDRPVTLLNESLDRELQSNLDSMVNTAKTIGVVVEDFKKVHGEVMQALLPWISKREIKIDTYSMGQPIINGGRNVYISVSIAIDIQQQSAYKETMLALRSTISKIKIPSGYSQRSGVEFSGDVRINLDREVK